MKKEQGFTLIELVIVIIILGILSVAAAPKFISLKDDAQKSVILGSHAALKASFDTIYLKASLLNYSKYPGIIDSISFITELGFGPIHLVYGKPRASWTDSLSFLLDNVRLISGNETSICDSQGNDFCALLISNFRGKFHNVVIFPDNYSISQNCFFRAYQNTDTDGLPVSGETKETALGTSYDVSGC